MFNKEKKTMENKMQCPWHSNYGFVLDYTFATRLFGFLSRMYKDSASYNLMDEEEYEYLLRSAANLKIWQMQVPTELNQRYFKNLMDIKPDKNLLKYLKAIGCKNAYDIEKYLNTNTTHNNVQENMFGHAYVAVNPDGEFRIFESKPQRQKEEIKEIDYSVTLEDHYGKDYHPYKGTGKYKEFWSSGKYHNGGIVNKENLPIACQNLTWKDEPMPL